MPSPPAPQPAHLSWLKELTALPSASGREGRIIRWVREWVSARADLVLTRDDAGNVFIRRDAPAERAPVLLQAHMDHPAFVVEAVAGDTLQLTFRGTVGDEWFTDARITVHTRDGGTQLATVVSTIDEKPLRTAIARLDDASHANTIATGDVAVWELPESMIDGDILMAPSIDDAGGVAAALSAFEILRNSPDAAHVGVMLTRAEEIGFVGATAACRLRSIPKGARLLTIETSRAYADSPVGGGAIVRVGDKTTTFSPDLTHAVCAAASRLTGRDTTRISGEGPASSRSPSDIRWSRRLMPGGTCEATTFCCHGYEATGLCVPLGNYHNQGDLDAWEQGRSASPRPALEYISLKDFRALIDILAVAAVGIDEASSTADLVERYYAEVGFVLSDDPLEDPPLPQ